MALYTSKHTGTLLNTQTSLRLYYYKQIHIFFFFFFFCMCLCVVIALASAFLAWLTGSLFFFRQWAKKTHKHTHIYTTSAFKLPWQFLQIYWMLFILSFLFLFLFVVVILVLYSTWLIVFFFILVFMYFHLLCGWVCHCIKTKESHSSDKILFQYISVRIYFVRHSN